MDRATVVLLATISLGRSVAHAGAPIVGGTPVPPGTWPDAVAVIGTTGVCTGTLIAPDLVLTAGHCADISPAQIIANTTDYGAQGGVNVDVATTTTYPAWSSTYDVALIALANPVPGVTPRAVATACTFEAFGAGSHVELVGFGLTDADATGTNTELHEASASVTDPTCGGGGEGCQPSVAPGGEFIAGGNGIDTCNGDSGGPVYLDTPRGAVVVGVVSRGVAGAPSACGGGGIYVRTDKVATWLAQTGGAGMTMDDCSAQPSGDGSAASGDARYGAVAGGCAVAPVGSLWIVIAFGFVRRRPARGHACPSPGHRAR